MFQHAKAEWLEFKHWPAGRRFSKFYEKHRQRNSRGSHWTRFLVVFAAAVSLCIGVVLVFIPGPAILFFAITTALIATQSRWLARYLDGTELWVRRRVRSFQRRRGRGASA